VREEGNGNRAAGRAWGFAGRRELGHKGGDLLIGGCSHLASGGAVEGGDVIGTGALERRGLSDAGGCTLDVHISYISAPGPSKNGKVKDMFQ